MISTANILFIGCGKMGGAILRGVQVGSEGDIVVIDPAPPPEELKPATIAWLRTPDDLPSSFAPDIIVIAVKPQQLEEALAPYSKFRDCVWLSIVAGKTINKIDSLLGGKNSIVRTMPNLPVSISKGISAAIANENATQKQKDLCNSLLSHVGDVVWVKNEDLMDAVTALSGSGPAYLFSLVEAMASTGVKIGLDEETSLHLAKQTIIGSAALLEQSCESPDALCKAVTSPGGTTAAALQILLAADGLPSIILRALEAAKKRSQELAE